MKAALAMLIAAGLSASCDPMAVSDAGVDAGETEQSKCVSRCQEVMELECVDDDFNCGETQCPEQWNATGLDYGDYVDCVFEQYQCSDAGALVFVPEDCAIPSP